MMATFVLVHGSFCGSWVWQKLTPLLRAAGHEVFVPGLTGLSDRSHLLACGVDLETHITDVSELLFYEDLSDVILVGHSYAGMVITGVAATVPERLKLLIYLDAYVPAEGQNEVDLWPEEWQDALDPDEAAGRGYRQPLTPSELGIEDSRLGEWISERLTPQPLATYTQPVPAGIKQSNALPRVFIHCTEGPITDVFAPFTEKAGTEGWEVHEIETGHMPMLTATDRTAGLLTDISSRY